MVDRLQITCSNPWQSDEEERQYTETTAQVQHCRGKAWQTDDRLRYHYTSGTTARLHVFVRPGSVRRYDLDQGREPHRSALSAANTAFQRGTPSSSSRVAPTPNMDSGSRRGTPSVDRWSSLVCHLWLVLLGPCHRCRAQSTAGNHEDGPPRNYAGP